MHYLSLRLSKLNILAVLILTLLFPARNIKADYIYLKDGSIISGVLVEEKVNLLIYRVSYGEMFINRENINKIIHESKEKPLVREAEKYLNDKKFKQAIKTAGEALEINPDSTEAMELKQKAIDTWQKYETAKEAGIQRKKAEHERKAKELQTLKTALKTKWGIAINKEKNNYIIADVYYNCPLTKGEIQPGDILIAIHGTGVARLSIKKVYDLLLTLKKIKMVVKKPVVLSREEILWRGTKKYVGLGISIEKIDNGIKITNIMPDGPAVKAGVLKDDIIVSLKGQSINSASMDDIINLLKGSAGTKLNATVEREIALE